MKKIITGIIIWLTGMVLLVITFVIGAGLVEHMHSWNSRHGRFWSALIENNLMPIVVIAAIITFIGIAILFRASFGRIFPVEPFQSEENASEEEIK